MATLARRYEEKDFYELGQTPGSLAWVRRVGWGCCVYVTAGLLGSLAGPLVHEVVSVKWPMGAVGISLLVWGMLGLGAMLVTSPLKGEEPTERGLRQVTRVLMMGGIVCAGLVAVLVSGYGRLMIGILAQGTPLPAIALAFAILSGVPGFYYLARIATRLSKPVLGAGLLLMAGVSLVSMAMMLASVPHTRTGEGIAAKVLNPDVPLVVRGSSIGQHASGVYAMYFSPRGRAWDYPAGWLAVAYVGYALLGWLGIEMLVRARATEVRWADLIAPAPERKSVDHSIAAVGDLSQIRGT